MLMNDGWAISEPYRGTLVRTFDLNFITNAQDVRRALEMLAIEDAIKHIDLKTLEKLKFYLKMQERCIQDNHPAEFVNYDRLFHEQIYLISKNDLLVKLIENLNDIIRFFAVKILMNPDRKITTIEEHEAIINAIEKGDVELARNAMDYHLKKTNEAILRYSESTDPDSTA